jgi:hypothetical protein
LVPDCGSLQLDGVCARPDAPSKPRITALQMMEANTVLSGIVFPP